MGIGFEDIGSRPRVAVLGSAPVIRFAVHCERVITDAQPMVAYLTGDKKESRLEGPTIELVSPFAIGLPLEQLSYRRPPAGALCAQAERVEAGLPGSGACHRIRRFRVGSVVVMQCPDDDSVEIPRFEPAIKARLPIDVLEQLQGLQR